MLKAAAQEFSRFSLARLCRLKTRGVKIVKTMPDFKDTQRTRRAPERFPAFSLEILLARHRTPKALKSLQPKAWAMTSQSTGICPEPFHDIGRLFLTGAFLKHAKGHLSKPRREAS